MRSLKNKKIPKFEKCEVNGLIPNSQIQKSLKRKIPRTQDSEFIRLRRLHILRRIILNPSPPTRYRIPVFQRDQRRILNPGKSDN